MNNDQWDCGAYGPVGRQVHALCFAAGEPGVRLCASQAACDLMMDAIRRKTFDRIQKLAAAGDELGIYLAGEFTSPDQLLGGTGADGA